MAGIKKLASEIKVKCPHCGRSLDLSDVGPALFARILEALCRHEPVVVQGFGKFHVTHYAAKEMRFKGETGKEAVVKMPPYHRIVFKAAALAKQTLRERLGKPKRVPVRRGKKT